MHTISVLNCGLEDCRFGLIMECPRVGRPSDRGGVGGLLRPGSPTRRGSTSSRAWEVCCDTDQ